ncbi:hypothetical protein GQ53DRAFT_170587 [Thozetella sp. PMI_491]|nr:hypothetical protein GQ53DRAFT_170587 [Thozetella sp. PMI_491]
MEVPPLTPDRPREPGAKSRSSTGCVTCRLRKVKCDEGVGGCKNCSRLEFKCSFSVHQDELPSPSEAAEAAGARDGVPKRRVRQACAACHGQKVRCTGEVPRCRRCTVKGIVCLYGSRSGRVRHTGSADSRADAEFAASETPQEESVEATRVVAREASPSSRSPDPSKAILQQHVDAFFEYVYPAASFNFIHRGSFLRTWHNGNISRSLICTIAAVASRFIGRSGHASPPGFRRWIEEVQREIVCDLEVVSLPKLQILLLLIYDHIASGNVTTVWYLTLWPPG